MKEDVMKTVLCFGDSNTWGCIPYEDIAQPSGRLAFEKRWPNILASHLEGVRVVEEGLPGRTTVFDDPSEGLHKNGTRTLIATIESHVPLEVIIIMLGTNDF